MSSQRDGKSAITVSTSREKIVFEGENLQVNLRNSHLKVMLMLYNVAATVSPWTHYHLAGMLDMYAADILAESALHVTVATTN